MNEPKMALEFLILVLVFMCPVMLCTIFDRTSFPFGFFLNLAGLAWICAALSFAWFAFTHI